MTDDGENVLATEVLWTPQVRRVGGCVCIYIYVCVYRLSSSHVTLSTLHTHTTNTNHPSIHPTNTKPQPQDEADVLTKRDVIEDYPELIDI